ncbi:N-acetylmuramoyl-L-alanine amidase [Oceanobacillus piezotolerans]|uniref:N-acetylmuramoyl-L-alanine amidase n=1 Tax=Oceanobacillus piezotolerans TaxID=2448030 RepID=A0A498DFE1_9BACI|nr:N-acetylmuramoyl-L-alanine amidase [Oceanobacillus piezotolerans]RLL42728.1 N-acetylmuramoyl-L-alanine amidase [Oceanobacillus piezotolerans]
MKLYLDPGHGGTDPGALGNGLREKDVNLDIALRIRSLLVTNYENVSVMMSRTTDSTKDLQQRTNEANNWGADYYVSIHCNAFNGTARGYEDFIHDALSDATQTARYRDILHEEIAKVNQLTNRGKKKANLHVLRETTMPAVLTENGFIDNSQDAALMKLSTWRQNVAQGHVNGISRAFNLQPKQTSNPPGTLYKVIAGSFTDKTNADERAVFLQSRGIDAFVITTTISGRIWYRVQAGAFNTRENAEQRLQEVLNTGVDAFIIVE